MKKAASIHHVLKYTAVFGSVQMLSILMSMVRSMLTARIIGPVGTGHLAIYNDSSAGVASMTNMGLPFSAVRNLSEIEDEDKALHYIMVVRTWALWTGLLGALVCILFAPVLARWFSDDNQPDTYANGIMALAPMVCALAVSGGELSILKGMKRLKRVASISAVGAVTTLFTTVPVYYVFGMEGVVMALVISTVAHMIVHLCFTVGTFPYKVCIGSAKVWHEGLPMVRLGIPFIMAGVAGSGAILAVTAYLAKCSGEDAVGLYKAGYALMVTYAGMVFACVENDYFPRLSAVNHNREACNSIINQQACVCLLLMGPLLIALSAFMPLAVSVLYGERYMVVVGMCVASVFYMLMRCISVPVAYLALAKGRSVMYLTMEVVYDIVSALIIIGGYKMAGLSGSGWALSVCGVFDALLVGCTFARCYGYRISYDVLKAFALQSILLAGTVVVCLMTCGTDVWRYAVCMPLFGISAWISYIILTGKQARES